MNLTDLCLRRPVFAWMLMFGTILFGIIAVGRIGVSQFPDVNNPTVSVSVSWPGASPEDVETGLITPIEDVLSQVTGVLEITSSARHNSARVTATFDIDRNIDLAVQDVQAKIAQIQRRLPTGVEPPTVSKSNPDDTPIITVGVSGPFSRQLLADVARYQLAAAMQTIDGVGQVQMTGYLDRAIRIWVDAKKLVATNVTVSDITAALRAQHVTSSGGQMQNGQRAIDVRVIGEAADLATLRQIVVKRVGSTLIRLGDVALVQDGFVDVSSVARMNGTPVQGMGILKQPGSNAVTVAHAVRRVCEEVQAQLPPGMQVDILFDTTQFIEEAVEHIFFELVLAVILTALVCWLFLGSLSSTLNVLFAIPMSLLGTVAVIYFLGWTLNTFTLLALSLAVGLVVDDAVMVMENIYRHAEMGKDRVRASSEGTKEITFAALAATLAVIAIFLPVAFMQGIIGKYFLQFGVTLSVAVAISYIEAITLAPARCAQMLVVASHSRKGFGAIVERGFQALERGYGSALKQALRIPVVVVLIACGVTYSAWWTMKQLQQEMVPSQDQSRLQVRLTAAVGSDLAETDRLVKKAEALLAKFPEISRVLTTVNVGSAQMSLTLVGPKDRSMSQLELQAKLRRELSGIPGLKASVQDLSQQGFGGGRGKPIDVSVRGPDWNTLISVAKGVQDKLRDSGLSADVDTDYDLGPPELAVWPDRPSAADVGVNVSEIATTINTLIGGQVLGQYSTAGRRMDIRMRVMAAQRTRPEDLELVQVRATNGTPVPLSSVVKHDERAALQTINHANRQRAIRVTGNVAAGHAQSDVLAYVEELKKGLPLGYSLVLSGQSSQFGDSMASLVFALIVGIAVAYMVLASQFNSLLHPVTVLTILPLSLAGAMMALWISGKTLNIFSMIGLLLLMGIVKKNSIILVDYANEVRREPRPDGVVLDARAAMQLAGPVRLRPILMTALATMMAAVPSAAGLGSGSETRGPMAIAIIGGLILSTVLSLFVVPAFYVLGDRASTWRERRKARRSSVYSPPSAIASDHKADHAIDSTSGQTAPPSTTEGDA
ncbi:MAG: efflux RND transporter permease subunit [Deltaproteobacteria bacterium]|nr:efflux RND transporter permease subunit [Deltaproteobacteria bacterium]